MDQRERLIERVARALAWDGLTHDQRIWKRRTAAAIVDDLLAASAEGKAVERALKVIEKNVA
jgi:uncharacterized protein involved in type VI secretion and phage assembly